MVACRHVGNSLIIVVECMALRDGILAAGNKGFSNIEIEEDSNIAIDYYSKRINIPSSIFIINGGYLEVVSWSKYL